MNYAKKISKCQEGVNVKNKEILAKEYFSIELYKYIVSAGLSLIMGGFILVFSQPLSLFENTGLIAVTFSLIYFVALLFISRLKNIDFISYLMICAFVAAVIVARVSMLPAVSMDYHNFIHKWLISMSQMSFSSAVTTEIGDYNLPYLYFLVILSRFRYGWMVVVKAFSCIFDVILAYYVMKIASLKINNNKILALVFALTLAIPTVLLNGAFWGQCDSIYGAMCIASIYYALCDKGTKSIVMFSLAFAFKLQAIFIIPFLLICFILQKIKWYKLLIVPIIYILCMMPAIFLGRGLIDSLFVYVRQASQSQYAMLTLNAPSVWMLFEDGSYQVLKWVGIMLAAVVSLAFVYLCYIYADRLETPQLVTVAYLTAFALPFFLPSMHERYFFIADVLSVLVFIYDRKKWYVPLVTVLASFAAYAIFLIIDAEYYNLRIFAVALLVVFVVVTKDFVEDLRTKEPVREFVPLQLFVIKTEVAAESAEQIDEFEDMAEEMQEDIAEDSEE